MGRWSRMSRFVEVVLSNAVEGREKKYGEWHDGVHIPGVMRVPGCASTERFRINGIEERSRSKHQSRTPYRWDMPSEQSIRNSRARARIAGILRADRRDGPRRTPCVDTRGGLRLDPKVLPLRAPEDRAISGAGRHRSCDCGKVVWVLNASPPKPVAGVN